MLVRLLSITQPFVVISYLIAGILCLLLKRWQFAIINLGLVVVNYFIFYGDKAFK